MTFFRGGSVILVLAIALALSACSAGDAPDGVPGTWLMERDAATDYLASASAAAAREQAIIDIKRAGTPAERALLEAYLDDPAYTRQLPSYYSDYLLELFTANEIEALIDRPSGGDDFRRQVAMHRFVLAHSLAKWHVAQADLDRSTVFDDPFLNTLATVIRATPGALIPPSQLG